MVKLGIGNSRMKDFWDVRYLIKEFEFDGALLQKAIRATFANRQTPLPQNLPLALTEEFAANPFIISRWSAFIKRNRITAMSRNYALKSKEHNQHLSFQSLNHQLSENSSRSCSEFTH